LNIVLVGLISSGKTSVGKVLAKKINADFLDLDDCISEIHEESNGEELSVQEIFKKYGEKYFRDLENQAIKNISKMNNRVIATGGGALERRENAEMLKKNGFIIFLNVDLQILLDRVKYQRNRPIFKGLDPIVTLKEIEKKRVPIFKQYSDIEINVSSESIDFISNKILEGLQ